MNIIVGFLIFILFCIVIVQVAKLSEISSALRGEEQHKYTRSKRIGNALMIFMVLFLIGTIGSAIYYKNYMLGYGPHQSASEHGGLIDSLMKITIFFTGIVFVATHIALFYFSWKYREKKGHRANFMSHDDRLELIWTVGPSIVLVFLVLKGVVAWNEITSDVGPDDDYIEIEATGLQFSWIIRYPGADGEIGSKYFTNITGTNPLGQIWTDTRNLDDFQPNEIVLPKGKKVRVRITSRDVLHNFYLPHFRMKMDAVPGMPTYFVFTPSMTTEEYRQKLKDYKEYQVPADPEDPEGPQKWEAFEYELACAELCGNGHYSMRKIVRIVEPAEYERWLSQQNSYYMTTIRNSDDDPFKGQLLDVEIDEHKRELRTSLESAMSGEDKSFLFGHIEFELGSAELTPNSLYQVEALAELLSEKEDMRIELSGHTDNTGDAADNLVLSQERARAIVNKLVEYGIGIDRLESRGYGQTEPIESNETEDGRAANRRTEITIL